jgi:dihydroorotase
MGHATTPALLIRGGRVLDPGSGVDRQADVLLQDGRVARIDRGIVAAAQIVDVRDRLVVPGLVDLHAHLREPGETHKEDLASGTQAAAAGGFTTICCMPNTRPPIDSRAVTELILRRAEELGGVRVRPIGAITRGLAGQALCDHDELRRAGVVAISDDGRCVMNAALMRRALERAAALLLPLVQHCEDHDLSASGAVNEGSAAARGGVSAQPGAAESLIVARDLELVELVGGATRYHVAHVSTGAALRHIRRAKSAGLPVTCEATPHHLTLTDDACTAADTSTKVNPPLRGVADRAALLEALADGTIDAIATDHAPHSRQEKEVAYDRAPFGISGLETALPLCLALWREGLVPLERLIALLTCNPARAFGLDAGTLAEGAPGDVTVIDVDREWVVDPAAMRSRGHNTPFSGWRVRGAPVLTVARGQIVFAA